MSTQRVLSSRFYEHDEKKESIFLSPSAQESRPLGENRVCDLRETVLQTIRSSFPIGPLFDPKLKIHLPRFISDQIFIRKIASFLHSISGEKHSPEIIKNKFEKSDLFQELEKAFDQSLLPLFYQACVDVLKGKAVDNPLKFALEGRVYTLKNALIAQKNPQALIQTQANKQSKKSVQQEGADFIRYCLMMHLNVIKNSKLASASFKEQLKEVAEQLVPFVKQLTKSYMKEYVSLGIVVPDDPLRFRNPTGYNRHAFIAATVMEVALQVLGYRSQLMLRTDLEPKATLATAHCVVKVTGDDGTNYVVDPTYSQFHQDIYFSGQELPKDPVLVLESSKVEEYVDQTIMPIWRNNYDFTQSDEEVFRQLSKNDQLYVYYLNRLGLKGDTIPEEMEPWVRSAMMRPWDLNGFDPVLSNAGFQEIFNGQSVESRSTYNLIKEMGISQLTSQRPLEEITQRLDEMVQNEIVNSPEAMSLIAQLPRNLREKYSKLLDIDPRATNIDACINAYFRSVCRVVNPQAKDFRVVYGCSGADVSSVLETTNATELFFVDTTNVSFEEFESSLTLLASKNPLYIQNKKLVDPQYFDFKKRYCGSESVFCDGKAFMENLPNKLFTDLMLIGVDLQSVRLVKLKGGMTRIEFPWGYEKSSHPKMRSIVYLSADITKPEAYPSLLKEVLKQGIDAFFMKGAFFAPKKYPEFLPIIGKAIKDSGWLLTTDKTSLMERIDPESCLKDANLKFQFVEEDEPTLLANLMQPPFDPFLKVPLLGIQRICRTTGTDLSYWTRLNLRKKTLDK
jgi:hypothetical protein